MRRAALFCALLGFVAAGVGCNVVTGQHDCTYDPSNMPMPSAHGGPQYPTVGPVYGGAVVTAPPVALPATDGK